MNETTENKVSLCYSAILHIHLLTWTAVFQRQPAESALTALTLKAESPQSNQFSPQNKPIFSLKKKKKSHLFVLESGASDGGIGTRHAVNSSFPCTAARTFLKLSHSPCLAFCFHLQFNTQDYWYYRHEKTISFGARTGPLMHNSVRR